MLACPNRINFYRRVISDANILPLINSKGIAFINNHPSQDPYSDGFLGTKVFGIPVFLHFNAAARVYDLTSTKLHYVLTASLDPDIFEPLTDDKPQLFINTAMEANIARLRVVNQSNDIRFRIDLENTPWSFAHNRFPRLLFSDNGVNVKDPSMIEFEFFICNLPPPSEYLNKLQVYRFDHRSIAWEQIPFKSGGNEISNYPSRKEF